MIVRVAFALLASTLLEASGAECQMWPDTAKRDTTDARDRVGDLNAGVPGYSNSSIRPFLVVSANSVF